jgi:cytochrome c-type biogenesis protein CcmH
LFVFVRDAQNAGPPLAVIRRQAGELPVTLQISDADIMLPGRTLASLEEAKLVARVANGGDPIAKPGDVYGEARWQRNAAAAGPVAIVIDRVVVP